MPHFMADQADDRCVPEQSNRKVVNKICRFILYNSTLVCLD